MITLSVAQMLVDLTARRPQDEEPTVQTAVAMPEPRGFARLLPARLRHRLAERASERELANAIRRLDELSPHLLDDIGMSQGALADLADVPPVPAVASRMPFRSGHAVHPAVSRPDGTPAVAVPAAPI